MDGDFTGDIKFSFCDGGGGDTDIWFVACYAFSAPLHSKKSGNVLWYFKQLPAKTDNDNDFKNNKL